MRNFRVFWFCSKMVEKNPIQVWNLENFSSKTPTRRGLFVKKKLLWIFFLKVFYKGFIRYFLVNFTSEFLIKNFTRDFLVKWIEKKWKGILLEVRPPPSPIHSHPISHTPLPPHTNIPCFQIDNNNVYITTNYQSCYRKKEKQSERKKEKQRERKIRKIERKKERKTERKKERKKGKERKGKERKEHK